MKINMGDNMVSFYVFFLFVLFRCTNGLLDGTQDISIEARFQALSQEMKQLQHQVSSLQSQVNSQNVTQTGPVAFTAGLSRSITHMGSHQQIVFEHVITNVGNGYSHLDGHFTAPVKGVYVFFVTLTNLNGHSASIDLLKSGQFLGHALAHGSTKDDGLLNTSTIAVIVQLEQGDHVWVQNEWAYTPVEQLDGNDWTMFSGHLVSAN